MQRIIAWWKGVQAHAHQHHKTYHRCHHGTHVAYLALVAFHGPYNLAAGAMLAVLTVGWLLHLEGEGA